LCKNSFRTMKLIETPSSPSSMGKKSKQPSRSNKQVNIDPSNTSSLLTSSSDSFTMDNDNTPRGDWYYVKFSLLIVFILGDLFLNSKVEYEGMLTSYDQMDVERMQQLQVILFGCIIVVQVSLFSSFFLMLCDTLPFQVGLIGMLAKQFKALLILQPSYLVLTCIVGAMRMVSLSE
jgi:hypothetical protein